jgi:hypothetical protein
MLGEAQQRVARAVEDSQRAGLVRDDLTPDAIAAMLVTLAMGVVQMFELGVPLEPEQVREAVIRMLSSSTA